VSHDIATLTQLQALAGPLIRKKVGQFLGKAGFRTSDRSDLEQSVWTKLLERLTSYKPEKRRPLGFLAKVIDRVLLNLTRDRFAQKRDFRRVQSLHEQVATSEGYMELGNTIGQEEEDSRQGRSPRSNAEKVDLVQDVAAVIARLSPDKQELMQQLKDDTLSEVARQRRVPRSTLQAQVRQLVELFENAGLRAYL
jgi:RNA polymerase sigma factor (sigma-70 family)